MNIDLRKLRRCCDLEEKSLLKNGSDFLFVDNGADVLGIVHLDTVQPGKDWKIDGNRIYHPKLDDRLGLYVLTSLLPSQFGIKVDWLFTTDEEFGASTARMFVGQSKDYNWIFSFDKAGEGCVMYQYLDDMWRETLRSFGFEDIRHGIYSDICELESLEVKGFNFGIGYQDCHSPDAYFEIDVLISQVEKFVRFYHEFKDIRLEHKDCEFCESCDQVIVDDKDFFYDDCYYLLCKGCYDEFKEAELFTQEIDGFEFEYTSR